MSDLVSLGMALYVARMPDGAVLDAIGARVTVDAIELRVDERVLRLNVNAAPDAVDAQTRGIVGYLASVCGVADLVLTSRMRSMRVILGAVIDPALAPEAAIEAGWRVARSLDAIVFLRGAFHDASGRVIAAPKGVAPPVTVEDVDAPAPGPPSPERVANRVRVLAAIAARGFLERERERARALTGLEDLRRWVTTSGIERELEDEERDLLFEPTIGALGTQPTIDAIWQMEGAAVLAWSLGLLELPPHDAPVDARTFFEAIAVRAEPPARLRSPRLRSAAEILAQRERLFTIHWRLVDFRVRPQALDFAAVAARSKFGLVTDTAMLAGVDLSIRGRAIAEADRNHVGVTESIARERHQAANWLVGDGYTARYSEVGTDT